jgi:hypothetical protein
MSIKAAETQRRESVTQKFLEFKKKNPMVDIENSALWVVRHDQWGSACTTMKSAIPSGISDRKLKNTLKKLRSKGIAEGSSWEIHFDAEAHTKNIFEYTSSAGIKLKNRQV